MKTIRQYTLLALLLMAGGMKMQAQSQKPFKLQVGGTGYATWINPDYLEQTVFDFNDGQLPDGWTISSEGPIVEPWHIETLVTNPQLHFPPDGSAYLYAHSDQLNGTDYMAENFNSPGFNLLGYKRAFVQFDYDYFAEGDCTTSGTCAVRSEDVLWSWGGIFYPGGTEAGRFVGEITSYISSYLEMRFQYFSCSPDNHFAIDNVCILGEVEAPVSNNVLGFRLWLDGVLIGDVTETEYQIDTDTLQDYHTYTLSVASILADGISDTTAFVFDYVPCSDYAGVADFHGEFLDSTRVKLTWSTPYVGYKAEDNRNPSWFWQIPDVVTHPGAGYNNGWDISALHDGLTAYGFNADKDAGFKVMDKFNFDWTYGSDGFYGIRFYVYEGATPFSTITGIYLTLYDGDPLDGGQIVAGGPDHQCLIENYQGSDWAHIYRTGEDDFSDVSRPIYYAKALFLNPPVYLEEGTYWFVVSFTGTLRDDVHVIPVNRLGETTTGEARIYSEATGWQPMIDTGTQTQQGIAFDLITHSGIVCGVRYSDIFRDGELIAHGVNNFSFIDENVPHGIHTYSIQNIYTSVCTEFLAKSCLQDIDVKPSYPPKNMEISSEQLNETEDLYRVTWDKEDDIPLRDDVKTTYEIYRKHASEDLFRLVGTLAKDNALESFEYLDTVPQGIYYYKVNDYNVYPTGSCESGFATEYCNFALGGHISTEVDMSQDVEGIKVEFGEDLFTDCFHFDTGEYIDAYGAFSNLWWAIKMTDQVQYFGNFLKEISLYCVGDGVYDFMIYTGGSESPVDLVWQKSVRLNGVNQWHTVALEEPYKIQMLPVWIIVHQHGVEYPAAFAADDGSSDEGRWRSTNGNHFMKLTNLGGSFMIRANIDNCLDGTDLLQMEEPTWGDLHYNLYRSCNNGSYEKIMQLPYPGVWCHVNYFDTINDFGYSCYNYKVTMTGLTSDGILCESTPAPNLHNPLIDWVEVCDTWSIEETAEDEHLVLYPNPTTGLLTIIMDDFSNAEVYDLMGHLKKRSKDTTLDLGGLAKGVYLLRITDADGKVYSNKITIR